MKATLSSAESRFPSESPIISLKKRKEKLPELDNDGKSKIKFFIINFDNVKNREKSISHDEKQSKRF